jgi:hypothetical protein
VCLDYMTVLIIKYLRMLWINYPSFSSTLPDTLSCFHFFRLLLNSKTYQLLYLVYEHI